MNPCDESTACAGAPRANWTTASDWVAGIALLAFYLISRPYRGVRHDAILYLGQALRRLMPDRFATDLFLRLSSQEKYSLFSPLMAPIVSHFGIGGPELLLLACCNALFMLAVWKLSAGWFDRPLRWVVMVFVAVLPHTYGGLGEFSYAEPFFTARSVAEPLALFALWQLLRGRLAAAIALAVLAALFHPLIVLPVLVIGWIVLVMRQRGWAWLGVLLLVPGVLAVLGIAPFDGLLRNFDEQWLAAVKRPDAQVFAGAHGILDWSPLAFDALVLVLVLRSTRIPETLRQLVKATLMAVVALTLAWVLGADVVHNVLLTQLQLWRIYWPMHLLATMALPLVLVEYWARGAVGRWCAAALGVAAIAVASNWSTGWACVLWALAALCVDHWRARVSDGMALGAVVASFLAMAGITAKVAWLTLLAVRVSPDNFGNAGPLLVVLGLPFVAGLLVVGLMWLLSKGGRGRAVALIAAAAGVSFGVHMWDQRSDWQRRLEASLQAGPPVFDTQIPSGASVYWDQDLIAPWLLAQRGNFFAYDQGAGLLFDRATALEFGRREPLASGVAMQREICMRINDLTAASSAPKPVCAPSVEVVAEICHGAVHPDFLVFAAPLAVPAVAEWHEGQVRSGTPGKSFYLYSCATLR
jgi:hypothetical protein